MRPSSPQTVTDSGAEFEVIDETEYVSVSDSESLVLALLLLDVLPASGVSCGDAGRCLLPPANVQAGARSLLLLCASVEYPSPRPGYFSVVEWGERLAEDLGVPGPALARKVLSSVINIVLECLAW